LSIASISLSRVGTLLSSTTAMMAAPIEGQACEPKWGSQFFEPLPCTWSKKEYPRQLLWVSISIIACLCDMSNVMRILFIVVLWVWCHRA
jgi:hypothetical protein